MLAMEKENFPYVIDMTKSEATNAEFVGRKAANLAVLGNAGFPVPDGLAVTTAAYDAFMAQVQDPSGMLGEDWLRVPLPELLDEMLAAAVKRWGDAPLAVRSSGVAEDLEGASFAGQYETVLDVRGLAAVKDAVRTCWSSAYSSHMLRYQSEKQIGAARMAVLIQPLVAADCAGVAFTANPVTGNREETAVSAVRGLGEKLVSGLVSPDEWLVRGEEARCVHAPEQAASADEILAVARLARQVERHFGCPQDIEWAISGGKVVLLQARPITALGGTGKAAEAPVPVDVPEGFWEREASHYPQPLHPFMSSLYVPLINKAFRFAFGEISLLLETIEAREIGGYFYQRIVPLGGKDRKAPPGWLMSVLTKLVPDLRNRIKTCETFVGEERYAKIVEQWYTEWKPEFMDIIHGLRKVGLKGLSDRELGEHTKSIMAYMEKSLKIHMLLNGAVNLSLAEFAFFCREELGWEEGKSMELLSGLSFTSSDPSRALSNLAAGLKENPELVRQLERINEKTMDAMREADPVWAKSFDEYQRQYGFRAIRYEVSDPILMEMPELMLNLLKDQLMRKYDPEAAAAELTESRERNRIEALGLLGDRPGRLMEFERLLQRAERAYPVREEHGFYDTSAPLAFLRLALLESGARMAERGQIDRTEDIFFLKADEVLSDGAIEGNTNYRDDVEERKRRRNAIMSNPAPASYGQAPPPPPPFDILPAKVRFAHEAVMWQLDAVFAANASGRKQTGGEGLRGIPASEGVYTGTVRVIKDESEFHKIQAGDVLVCPITSPVWSVLFSSIGALVADTGGILSHSAIIAREYRIPSVVATGNATELLRDGQTVTVNGTKGEIIVITGSAVTIPLPG